MTFSTTLWTLLTNLFCINFLLSKCYCQVLQAWLCKLLTIPQLNVKICLFITYICSLCMVQYFLTELAVYPTFKTHHSITLLRPYYVIILANREPLKLTFYVDIVMTLKHSYFKLLGVKGFLHVIYTIIQWNY